MHKLFTIGYLVREICSYMSRHELSSLTFVSSTWFRCAIPLLYRNGELWDVLKPLGKIINKDGSMIFLEPFNDEAFERFMLIYAPCVQTISVHSDALSIACEITQKCVSKNILYLFPNVRTVTLSFSDYSPDCLQITNHLLTPDVDHLYLHRIIHPRLLHEICTLAMTRISTLISVGIKLSFSDSNVANLPIPMIKPVQDLLTFFTPTLTSVHVLRHLPLSIPSIVECLSKMSNLWDLSIGDYPSEIVKHETMHNQSNQEDFPSLHSFSFDGSSQSLYDVFWKRYNFTFLTMFAWTGVTSLSDVDMAISTIAIACPRLISLLLGSQQPWDDVDSVVPWTCIQPVLRCKDLTHLSLNSIFVSVSLNELTEFLQDRKTWLRLDIFTWDPFRLEDLLIFAEHCPDLQELGVLIDLERDVQSLVELDSLLLHRRDIPAFSAIRLINFANSPIGPKANSDHLIKFLRRICQAPPKIFALEDFIQLGYVSKGLASLYHGSTSIGMENWKTDNDLLRRHYFRSRSG